MKMIKIRYVTIAAVAAILLTITIAVIMTRGDGEDKPLNSITAETTTTIINTTTKNTKKTGITGVWYSDQDAIDTLTLNQDGTYTSISWLLSGKYYMDEETITLSDSFGTTKALKILNTSELYFDNGRYSHSYFRTKDEVEKSKKKKEEMKEAELELYESVLMDILKTDGWVNAYGNTTLSFTDDEFTVVYTDDTGEEKYKDISGYTIDEIKVNNGAYDIRWTVTTVGVEFPRQLLTIKRNGDVYTLSSSAIPMDGTYTNTIKGIFDSE